MKTTIRLPDMRLHVDVAIADVRHRGRHAENGCDRGTAVFEVFDVIDITTISYRLFGAILQSHQLYWF